MDSNGFDKISKVVGKDTETKIISRPPEEDHDLPFVDVLTLSPADVLNSLHAAGLLASRQNQSDGKKDPRLELILSSQGDEAKQVLLTFFDTHSSLETSATFLARN